MIINESPLFPLKNVLPRKNPKDALKSGSRLDI